MTDIKQYEPLWGAWYVESPIGEGSFGKVYKIKKEEFGKAYWSAVKMLSIPQSNEDLNRARNEGLDEASARSYFHAFVTDIIQEVDLMYAFRGNSNIVSFEEHKVIEHEDEIGWDILIRMELLRSLSEYVTEKPLPPDEVIKLGIHICRALELCATKKTIHRDIKPDNIFVSQYGEYKLGDFGIARQIERTSSGLSKKGTDTYMAPEVYRGEEYGASVDTYSLGIVMYRYLNQNRPPFLSDFPNPISPRGREEALMRRMRGEALPPIPGVDPSLLAVVLKACAYERGERFFDAAAMRDALENISGVKNYAPVFSEAPEAPRQQEIPAASVDELTSATEGIFRSRVAPHHEEEKTAAPQKTSPVSPETLKTLSLFGGVCFAVLGLLCLPDGIGAGIFIFLPLYSFCVAECLLKFENWRVNVFFLSALLMFLAYSFLFEFSIFDYHMLILAWSLLALCAANISGRNSSLTFCLLLAACSIAAGFLVNRALRGIPSGIYHNYVAGGVAAPFLMFFISVTAPLLRQKKLASYALSLLLAVQFFPLVVFVWHVLSGSLPYIAGAGFTRIALGRFELWGGWRFCIALVQSFAFAPFFALAAVRAFQRRALFSADSPGGD